MSEEVKDKTEGSEETPSLPVTNLNLPEKKEENGKIITVKMNLIQKEDDFIKAVDHICELFQTSYYPIARSYKHYLGFVRGRTTENVLERGKELFKFVDKEILGKEIKEVAKQELLKAYEEFKKTDAASEYFYEFIIEFGRRDNDFAWSEQDNEWKNNGAAYDYFPIISEEEHNKRHNLAVETYKKEMSLAREKMAKETDITVQLENTCRDIEDELKKKENPSLRANLEKFRKNIEAIKTYNPIKNVDMNFMKNSLPKDILGKINSLSHKVNKILVNDGKSQRNFNDILKILTKITDKDTAEKFILKYLLFTASSSYTTYKIFIIKVANDLIRLKFNVNNDYGREIVKKIRYVCE